MKRGGLKNMNSKKLTAISLIVAISITMIACGKKQDETEEVSIVAVEVQNPEVGALSTDTTYIGTIAPEEQVYVIPKTSGTVTETFFEVGDTVKEGDVLFKIDDEAAQLQMANAKAAYETAQAGVTAQSSGARDLQNYQTEQQIQTLKKNLYETEDTIDDLESDLGDLRDNSSKLNKAKKQAQEASAAAWAEHTRLVSSGASQTQIEVALKAAQQADSTVASLEAQLQTINAAKTQLKSGIDSAENGKDTIQDNLTMAEQAYAITQSEVYPQSDAASAAQLAQASIGIDSAQMQLDFCTVKAPISGVVEAVNVEKNGMAAAGNAAYIISNKESMTATFSVAEKAKNFLNLGDHVTVERNGATFDGTITEIGTMANPQTKLFQVKASVLGASDILPNGVSVKVYATTQKEENKLIVPYDTIYFTAGDAYVYCVEDNKVVKTPVLVGLMNDTQAVIEEGLTSESLVIMNWSSKLRDGVEVEVVSVNGEAKEQENVEDTEGDTENSEEKVEEEQEVTEETKTTKEVE